MSQPPFPGPAGIADGWRFARGGGEEVGAWAVYLPLIGVGLGAVSLAVDALVDPLAGRVAASLAVCAVLAALTRGQPQLALARLLAALPRRRAERIAVLESGSGAAVSVALMVSVAAQLVVLCLLDRFRPVGLAFAPVLGGCSMVVLAVGSRAARADGRRLKFAPSVTFREFGVASTATFALVFLSTEFLGLLLVLATAAFTIAVRVALHRWIDGVNQTTLLAAGSATQLLILTLLAAL